MNLQSMYRLERDKIFTVENEKYYFAYRIINDEFIIDEIYIREDLRGNSKLYYDEIFSYVKTFDVKYLVGFIVPKIEGSERSMVSLLKFGFKLLKCDDKKITLYKEVI